MQQNQRHKYQDIWGLNQNETKEDLYNQNCGRNIFVRDHCNKEFAYEINRGKQQQIDLCNIYVVSNVSEV